LIPTNSNCENIANKNIAKNNKEEYIGKKAEVRYFETTDDGSLRFPVFCGIRLDK